MDCVPWYTMEEWMRLDLLCSTGIDVPATTIVSAITDIALEMLAAVGSELMKAVQTRAKTYVLFDEETL